MRPIEILLLLANLLAFTGLVLPLPRARRRMSHATPLALLAAGAQIAAEGPRWQMIPPYALSGLFVLIWLSRIAVSRTTVHGRAHSLATGVTFGLGMLAMAVSIALPKVLPVFRFPPSSGPYAIGTLTYHWIDAARLEVFGAVAQGRRELMVQI
jgi:hypothetical protein